MVVFGSKDVVEQENNNDTTRFEIALPSLDSKTISDCKVQITPLILRQDDLSPTFKESENELLLIKVKYIVAWTQQFAFFPQGRSAFVNIEKFALYKKE